MAKTKDLNNCRTASDFIKYAEHHGGHIDRVTGSHYIIEGPNGTCPVPAAHKNEQMQIGICKSITRLFKIAGICVIVLAIVYVIVC